MWRPAKTRFLNLPSDIIQTFAVEVVNKGCYYLRDCQLCIPITFDSIELVERTINWLLLTADAVDNKISFSLLIIILTIIV